MPAFGDERDQGAFIEPTILTGLPESARCVREEIFGPVCHVAPFDSEEEVIHMANDTRYGLAAADAGPRTCSARIAWRDRWRSASPG